MATFPNDPDLTSVVDTANAQPNEGLMIRFAGPTGVGEYVVQDGETSEVVGLGVDRLFSRLNVDPPPVESLTVAVAADSPEEAASAVSVGLDEYDAEVVVQQEPETPPESPLPQSAQTYGTSPPPTPPSPGSNASGSTRAVTAPGSPLGFSASAIDTTSPYGKYNSANDWPTFYPNVVAVSAYTHDYCRRSTGNFYDSTYRCLDLVKAAAFDLEFKWGNRAHSISKWTFTDGVLSSVSTYIANAD